MNIDTAGDDDNLWAKELVFAERGLEAVQNLRRVKNEAQSAPPPQPQAPPTPVQPTTPFESNDLLGPDDSDDDPDADDLARDVDGNLAPIEDTDDFMELNMMHDQELPPIPQDDYAREIEIEDIRQQHIMANQRRREANYLDNVKSLNITSLRIHASEFGRTRVQEGEQCELLKRDKNGLVTGDVVKIPLVGSLEFLDSEEERAMFHELDGKPWADRNPAWKTERLQSLQDWLETAETLVALDDPNDENAEKVVLNMNEFVGWTYLYRFMKEDEVATALQRLGNLLLPNNAANDGATEDYANLKWIRERAKFLDGLIKLLPTTDQMGRLDVIANFAESGEGEFDRYGKPEILSFTWSYLFFLLIYRQVIAHEFFIFCTYKHKVAPELEAVSTEIQIKVNTEESQDDIMHQKWQELLNKFALFRDILTGRQDRFTHHLQRYLTLSHERIKISHERNMVRSEKVVFATVYDWMTQNSKTKDIETLNKKADLTTDDVFKTEFFDNIPPPQPTTDTTSADPDPARPNLINRLFFSLLGGS